MTATNSLDSDHDYSFMDLAMDKKKQRPYSEYDKQVLIQLVRSKMGIIKNRKTDGVSKREKQETWEEIATEYNNSNVSQTADSKQLKKMWQNLKTKARLDKTAESQCKTGGGSPSEMGPFEPQVIVVVPNVKSFIDVPIDSDTVHTAGTSHEYDNDEKSRRPKRARKSDGIETKDIKDEQSVEKITEKQENKSVEDLKKDLLIQQIKHSKEKHKLEIEFLKENYKLELEILQLKKENLKKQLNN